MAKTVNTAVDYACPSKHSLPMNKLDTKRRAQIIACLVEGMSVAATCRITGADKKTVLRLLKKVAEACVEYHDKHVRNLQTVRLQADEVWSFVGAKDKNADAEKKEKGRAGSVWTWLALDADSKLAVSWFVGGRDAGAAYELMSDAASRIAGRVQLTTDGHKAYLSAVEDVFGIGVDYAMLVKLYGENTKEDKPPLFAGVIHRRGEDEDRRTARPEAHLDQLRGALQLERAHAHASLHAVDECVQQEAGEPHLRGGALLLLLQLCARSPDAARDSGNGSRRVGSRLDGRGDRGAGAGRRGGDPQVVTPAGRAASHFFCGFAFPSLSQTHSGCHPCTSDRSTLQTSTLSDVVIACLSRSYQTALLSAVLMSQQLGAYLIQSSAATRIASTWLCF